MTYERFDTGRKIRLFRIDPKAPCGAIRGSLETVSLDCAPSYAALSYVWGTAPKSQFIRCDGCNLHLTPNLEDALLQLSKKTTVRRYWIDQLCINQSCTEEKSQQIPLIGEIYNKASRVIVWLGPADEQTPAIWSLLQNLLFLREYTPTQAHELSIEQGFNIPPRNTDSEDEQAVMVQRGEVVIPPGTAPEWTVLKQFLSRPWFQRMWTYQEVVVSHRCHVFCGEYSMTWRDLSDACKAIVVGEFNDFWGSINHAVPSISIQRGMWHKNKRSKLSYLLETTRLLKAKEAADKVFALRALIDEQWARQIPVNYERPLAHIYADVVKTCIEDDQCLCVLSSVEARRAKSARIPSWVPDWTQVASTNVIFGFRDSSGGRTYSAAKDSKPVMTMTYDPLQLQLSGFVVAKVIKLVNVKARLKLRDKSIQEKTYDTQHWNTEAWMSRHKSVAKTCRRSRAEFHVSANLKDRISESLNSDATVASLRPEAFETAFRRTLTADRYPKLGQQRLDQTHITMFFREHTAWELDGFPAPVPTKVLHEHDAHVKHVMYKRRSFLAENDTNAFIGIALSTVREGDCICVLLGGDVPYVLRPEGENWHFVSEAYVHGIMDGEAMDWATKSQLDLRAFDLV